MILNTNSMTGQVRQGNVLQRVGDCCEPIVHALPEDLPLEAKLKRVNVRRLCRLPDVIPDPCGMTACGTEIVLNTLPLRMCVKCRIRVVSRALTRPFGGRAGARLFFYPPKSPFQGGPQGLAALWTPASSDLCKERRPWTGKDLFGGGAALLRLPWRVRLRGLTCLNAGVSGASPAGPT